MANQALLVGPKDDTEMMKRWLLATQGYAENDIRILSSVDLSDAAWNMVRASLEAKKGDKVFLFASIIK